MILMRRLFDLIAVAAIVALFAGVAMNWGTLPERVPVHFGMAGTPDRWSDPGSLILLPIVTVLLTGLLTVVGMFPQAWNLPAKVTAENQDRVFAAGAEMLSCLKAQLGCLFFWINWRTIAVARGGATGLGPLVPIAIPVVFVTMAYYIYRIMLVSKPRLAKPAG